MSFFDQPPSKEWAALKFRGERIAEVWFKPEGEPLALTFRIPRQIFQNSDMRGRLTAENLLKAVAIANDDVASWHHGAVPKSGGDGRQSELGQPLPPPPEADTHLNVYIRLKPPVEPVARTDAGEPEVSPEKWQEIEARWNAILGVEAALETLRISMEGLRAEMDASSKHALATEEKQHALSADMAQWNQLKSRLVYAVPKVREFIHRATWALGTPERKELGEFFKNHDRTNVTGAQLDQVQKQLDYLLKERQVLSAQGATVYQDCKRAVGEVQGALRALRSNAATNAQRKKGADRTKRRKG